MTVSSRVPSLRSSFGSIQDKYILYVGPTVPLGRGDARRSLGKIRRQTVIGQQQPEDAERDHNSQKAQYPARKRKCRVAKGRI